MDEPVRGSGRAKEYQRIKQKLSLFHLVWTPLLLAAVAFSPLSSRIAGLASSVSPESRVVTLAVYFTLFSLFILLFDLPLAFYSGYRLEHRFGLSNQTAAAWWLFFLKKALLSFVLSLGLILALYLILWNRPADWWIFAWGGYALVSYVLGKVFPVWIVPLFYRYEKVSDEALRERIFSLASRYGMPVENIYSLNLSKTTRKANAAFMGTGKTKRVVLSDTLLSNFTGDEIETVVAHELGHFKHHDIYKQLGLGLAGTFLGFWMVNRVLDRLADAAGYAGPGDPAAMPLLFLVFYGFSLLWTPLQSAFSRWMERQADRFALRACPRRDVFISCMRKLGEVNLADPSPHPLYEWFFYDHPSIGKRIRMAENWKEKA